MIPLSVKLEGPCKGPCVRFRYVLRTRVHPENILQCFAPEVSGAYHTDSVDIGLRERESVHDTLGCRGQVGGELEIAECQKRGGESGESESGFRLHRAFLCLLPSERCIIPH